MNILRQEKAARLLDLMGSGVGVREAARRVGCDKNTATRYRKIWIKQELQKAYDFLWDGDCERCDEITLRLPKSDVEAMLDAFLEDQVGTSKKSHWYSWE